MPTSNQPDYIVIGGLHLGSLAVECTDIDPLFADPSKATSPTKLPDFQGREPGPMSGEELLAALPVRIRGDMTFDNVSVPAEDRAMTYYQHLAALREVTKSNAIQDLELYVGETLLVTVDCQVRDGGVPSRVNTYTSEMVLSVALTDGVIDLSSLAAT